VDANGNPVSTAGTENWAYMPKFVMPGIYQIADTAYANAHRFMLDGSPEIGDVFDVTASVWKTIVVGGANGGARGFYALDITDPKNPKGLWEFCSDSTLCPAVGTVSHSDTDLGFTYGNPVIGKRLFDGKWVVVLTSGLNNVSPGTGVGFFYVLDAITGQVLDKVSTGTGTTLAPSGLMRHAGFFKAGLVDGTISFMYGGDLQGNVWRMDMSTSPPGLLHIATLKDAAGNPQPITVRPVATNLSTFRVYYVGTGRYLASTDPADTSQQSIYGFKDKDADYGTNIRSANLVTQTLSTGSSRTITNNTVNWSTQDGFVIDLNPGNTTPGERIVLDPRLELGTLVFASNVPIIGGCTAGGDSFVYNLDFSSGSYVPGTMGNIAAVRQGAFLVGFTPIQTTDGSIRTVNTDSSGGLGTGTVNINRNPKGISRFSYRER
jgi:type IV pilus assembly protein PilY1